MFEYDVVIWEFCSPDGAAVTVSSKCQVVSSLEKSTRKLYLVINMSIEILTKIFIFIHHIVIDNYAKDGYRLQAI